MTITGLAWKSLKHRKATVALTIFSIAISVTLLLGVERIRTETKKSFTHTLSGTDLVVGARSSPINLLLYSVFHRGNATNNVSWETYQELRNDPAIAWSIPLSLGDAHKGYRVVGTDSSLFTYFKYGDGNGLTMIHGKPFASTYDAVVGAEVAKKLQYHVGDYIVLSHGVSAGIQEHDDKPFQISGILTPTGTPLDRVILVPLQGIEALHVDWKNGAPPISDFNTTAAQAEAMDLTPASITAFLVGLKSRISVFSYQRKVNEYKQEVLTAILPIAVLQELWLLMGSAENALLAISVMVVLSGLMGMLTMILASLNERRREMAILRAIGADSRYIFLLMLYESIVYALAGTVIGFLMVYALLTGFQPMLENYLGLYIHMTWPGYFEFILAGAVLFSAIVIGIIPAWRAYRNSLSDGLTVKL